MTPTYIYGLVDPNTKDIRYIGKADRPEERLQEHLTPYFLSKKWHKNFWLLSLLKKNQKPKLIIIEKVSQETWKEREIFWIRFYTKLGAQLTNSTNGGEGISGWHHSDSAKEKIRKAHLGHLVSLATREKLRKANLGKCHSTATRLKISKISQITSRDNKFSNFAKQQCRLACKKETNQFSKENQFIRSWDCISDAAKKLKINKSTIVQCCKEKLKSAGGYTWRYK